MSEQTSAVIFNARTHGARGDGATLDTAAIQRAIDACAAAGGGTVLLHGGTFLSGSLFLKSHVTLAVGAGATLLGSPHLGDYFVDAQFSAFAGLLSPAFIYAEDCTDVAITGPGAIDGNGRGDWPSTKPRPMLIRLRRCRRAVVRDVLLRDFPAWGLHPVDCTDLRLEGITIDSYVQGNNDGIDLDGCERVVVSNCNIYSGDDSICLKTFHSDRPCRDIVITNCILSSGCAAIRLGPESKGNFERIAVSNCVIRDTGLGGIKLQMAHGAAMRDLSFSNIVMDNVLGPISIRLGGWDPGAKMEQILIDDIGWEQGVIENVAFSNIRARIMPSYMHGTPHEQELAGVERSCLSICGTAATRPTGISFSDISITCPGGGTAEEARREAPECERDYPELFMFGVPPAYGLWVRHADDIALRNVRFSLETPDLRPAVFCDDVTEFTLNDMKTPASADVWIRLRDTCNATFTRCRQAGGADGKVPVEGSRSRGILWDGESLR